MAGGVHVILSSQVNCRSPNCQSFNLTIVVWLNLIAAMLLSFQKPRNASFLAKHLKLFYGFWVRGSWVMMPAFHKHLKRPYRWYTITRRCHGILCHCFITDNKGIGTVVNCNNSSSFRHVLSTYWTTGISLKAKCIILKITFFLFMTFEPDHDKT